MAYLLAANPGRVTHTFVAAVARNAHISRPQTPPNWPEIPLHACLAATSGCVVRTVDTLAASAVVVLSGFRVQSRVVDTAGGVSVALALAAGVSFCLIASSEWFVIV